MNATDATTTSEIIGYIALYAMGGICAALTFIVLCAVILAGRRP
jgi:hypothetical protein